MFCSICFDIIIMLFEDTNPQMEKTAPFFMLKTDATLQIGKCSPS